MKKDPPAFADESFRDYSEYNRLLITESDGSYWLSWPDGYPVVGPFKTAAEAKTDRLRLWRSSQVP